MSYMIYPFSFSFKFPMVYNCNALFDSKNAFREYYDKVCGLIGPYMSICFSCRTFQALCEDEEKGVLECLLEMQLVHISCGF